MVEEKKDDDVHPFRGAGDAPSRSGPYTNLVDEVRSGSSHRKEAALGFLLRYETMVRQQEAEEMATLAYLLPCLERLNKLAGKASIEVASLDQSVRFVDLKTALDALEATNLQIPPQDREFLTVDGQLMMVLRILTKGVSNSTTTTLSWAEFLQCYKACVAGMLTLQHLPAASTRSSSPSDPDRPSTSATELRARTRDRTVSMLALFDPSSTELLTTSPRSSPSTSSPTSPVGEESSRRKEGKRHTSPRRLRFDTSVQWLSQPVILVGALVLCFVAAVLSWNLIIFRNTPVRRSVPKASPYRPAYNTSPLFPTSTAFSAPHSSFRADSSCRKNPGASPWMSPSTSSTSPGTSASAIAGGRCSAADAPSSGGRGASKSAVSLHHPSPGQGLTLWQQAAGGAVALPLVRPFLWPTTAAAATSLSTASVLRVAGWGAAGVLVASLAAHLLSWVGRWWLAPPRRRAASAASAAPQASRW